MTDVVERVVLEDLLSLEDIDPKAHVDVRCRICDRSIFFLADEFDPADSLYQCKAHVDHWPMCPTALTKQAVETMAPVILHS